MDVEVDKQCCRTCLHATTDNLLFNNPQLLKKLEFATSLKIIEGDGLPIYFCEPCLKRLDIAYKFRLQSLRSYKYIKNHIKQIQNQFNNIIKSNNHLDKVEENDVVSNFSITENLTEEYTTPITIETGDINIDPLSEKKPHSFSISTNRELRKKTKVEEEKCKIGTKNITKSSKNSKKTKNKDKKTIISNDDFFNENDGVEFSKCDVCKKMFRKGNLKRHKQTHTGNRKFECNICQKSFTQKSSLQRHHLIHTGEKPFKCEVCGKKFSQSKTLKFHMSLHGIDKTFSCSVCPYRFIKPENLANHMREKHSSENMDEVVLFVCQFCNKGFKSKYNLKVHKEKLHKGDIVFDMDWSDINNEDSDESVK